MPIILSLPKSQNPRVTEQIKMRYLFFFFQKANYNEIIEKEIAPSAKVGRVSHDNLD